MNKAFVALVGVYMLAELVDDAKLRQALESLPKLPQWSEIRQIMEREVRRRNELSLQAATGRDTPSEDAA
jgi:hypothetical protein